MYEARFGLERNPFSMTPDPSFLLQTPVHQEALSGLLYAVMAHKGFVVLTGEAGTGKTTLVSALLRFVPENRGRFSLIINPTLTASEFLESALTDFGISDVPASKVQRLRRLEQFLLTAQAQDSTCVLVVDEAHKLSPEVLEEIRLLTNFETAERKLLQIVLVGQDELSGLLNREDLRQLKQRIAVRFQLKPLAPEQVEQYIRHRWLKAGGKQPPPFHASAIQLISQSSCGIPRVINAICDNALLLIYAADAEFVTGEHIRQILADLDLSGPSGPAELPRTNGHQPQAPVFRLQLKPAPAVSSRPTGLRTLENYLPPQRKVPLLVRWADKVGLAHLERRPS